MDYNETSAPVVRSSTIRKLFTNSVKSGLKIDHLNVVIAFLNAELHEVIYIQQPEGFVAKDKEEKFCPFKRP